MKKTRLNETVVPIITENYVAFYNNDARRALEIIPSLIITECSDDDLVRGVKTVLSFDLLETYRETFVEYGILLLNPISDGDFLAIMKMVDISSNEVQL